MIALLERLLGRTSRADEAKARAARALHARQIDDRKRAARMLEAQMNEMIRRHLDRHSSHLTQ